MAKLIRRFLAAVLVVSISLCCVTTTTMASSERRGMTAGNLAYGGWVAESEGDIYFCYQGNLCKTQQGSEQIHVLMPKINEYLPDSYFGNLNVIGGWVYFKTLHGSIYRIPDCGGTPQLVLAGLDRPWVGVNEFVIVDDWLYYNYEIATAELARFSKLCRMRLDGSEVQELLNDGAIYWIKNVTGGYVYYDSFYQDEEEFHHRRIPVTGGQTEGIDANRRSMQIEDGWIYYLDSENHLRRANMDATIVEDIYIQGSCSAMNVSGDWVYCFIADVNEDGVQYARIRTDGTEVQMINGDEIKNQGSVAGDIISSIAWGTFRIREDSQGVWREKIEAGLWHD